MILLLWLNFGMGYNYPTYDYFFNLINTSHNYYYLKASVPKEWDREYLCEGCKLVYDEIIDYGIDANYPFDSYLEVYSMRADLNDLKKGMYIGVACFTTYTTINAMKPGLRGVLGEGYLNVLTDDSDSETNWVNITFNEAIELTSMKDEKPDKFILSNSSVGWKASKGKGTWTPNDVTIRMAT